MKKFLPFVLLICFSLILLSTSSKIKSVQPVSLEVSNQSCDDQYAFDYMFAESVYYAFQSNGMDPLLAYMWYSSAIFEAKSNYKICKAQSN